MTNSFPEWLEPMAATLTQERFTGPELTFERNLDGIRLLAFKNGSNVRLLSRNRRHTIQAQEIEDQLRQWRKTSAAHTCNLRRTALSHLFTTLDGPNAINPVREVPGHRASRL